MWGQTASYPEDRPTNAEIIYTFGGLPRPEIAPNLRWAQLHSAGINHITDQPFWQSDILITNASGIHAPQHGPIRPDPNFGLGAPPAHLVQSQKRRPMA
ncbi:MAG: hypothetical protein M5U34_38880 [Chloroflexi bacterium]|nr:hypothetical protein [Chloroflexota bacterium]